MTEAVRVAHWTVVGRYELMGVNGSLLPAPIDPGQAQDRVNVRMHVNEPGRDRQAGGVDAALRGCARQ